MDVRVSDHRLVDYVQIDFEFRVVLRVVIWSQRRFGARTNFLDALVRLVDQALKDFLLVVHSLVDHDLNAAGGDFQ